PGIETPELQSTVPESDSQAITALSAFESVGARSFDLSLINEAGRKVDFDKGQSPGSLIALAPPLLARCEGKRLNVIIRPRANTDRRLVQLDDLDASAVARLKDFSFLQIETSPANYQSWFAVEGADDSIVRRLKRALGADSFAS